MSSVPQTSRTVTDWYKQNVYDRNDNKIGEIMDVLVEPSGEVNAAIVGVGGFLGAGEKDVAVKFVNAAAKMHRLAGAKIHQRCWRAGPRTGGLRQTSDLGGIIRRCVRAGTA